MGVEVKLHTYGTPITPLESEETLFRVAQEALANVAQHSQARQVEIDLTWSRDQMQLTIRDNGKGFDLAQAAGKSVGLASMRERVEALHGTLLISSSAAGTTIEACAPLTMPVRMSEPITVCIVDDHAIVRHGIRALLEAEDDLLVVGEASSGGEAVLLAADVAPDVVLMDLLMPAMDGVEATRLLKQRSPHSQVRIMTSYDEDEHIFPAIRAGALSYLLKGVGLEELTEAVRKAARGEATLHPHVAARLVQELRGTSQETFVLSQALSQREREVLHLIAEGLSNARIAERLVIAERTVKSHVNNILSKLHLADRTQAAIFAWRSEMMG
jgi:NarL family two-component system response regulator LiaR